MFIRNLWYVAAWPGEVTSKPLARTLLGEPVVLYRLSDGRVCALEDRCVHRNMPLSMGTVENDRLVCPYHALAYAPTGRCVNIPAQDNIPTRAVIRSYPTVERDGAIWIWMGDPALAAPEQIVPYPHHNGGSGWAHRPGYCHLACWHELVSENLLDLTHIGWVHRNTIGGNANANARAKLETAREGDHVLVRRFLPNSPPPPTYIRAVGFTGLIDRWMEIDFFPALIRIYTGANDAGRGVDQDNYNDLFGARIFNGITPETEHTTHYFWSAAHNFEIDKAAVTDSFYAEVLATFLEDKAVMEAQYQRVRQFPRARNIGIASDAGAVKARRILEERLEAEAGSSPVVV